MLSNILALYAETSPFMLETLNTESSRFCVFLINSPCQKGYQKMLFFFCTRQLVSVLHDQLAMQSAKETAAHTFHFACESQFLYFITLTST